MTTNDNNERELTQELLDKIVAPRDEAMEQFYKELKDKVWITYQRNGKNMEHGSQNFTFLFETEGRPSVLSLKEYHTLEFYSHKSIHLPTKLTSIAMGAFSKEDGDWYKRRLYYSTIPFKEFNETLDIEANDANDFYKSLVFQDRYIYYMKNGESFRLLDVIDPLNLPILESHIRDSIKEGGINTIGAILELVEFRNIFVEDTEPIKTK